jgi:two-component system response regulator AtoC
VSTPLRGSVLLVDDEEGILKTLGRALHEEGHEVVATPRPADAERHLAERGFDVLIVDNRMPGKTGLELIRDLVQTSAEGDRPQVILMTAHATVDNAIEAMKLGAFDYLQKPFEVDELLVAVGRALEHQRLRGQHRYLLHEQEEQFDHYGIIGRSQAMQGVIRTLERVAQARSTVLITGETGTGKELAARAIHARSPEREMPLIKVNCAAIPEALLESELFGHVRGAFTGATSNRRGRFTLADGGTIFLDEIGTLGLPVQAKLLRVLQEREFEPVGSERMQKVDVRVIAATNRDLRALMSEERFQEDLYYRLSVIPIELPPLRKRREDIPPLVDHFVRKHAQRIGREIERVEDAALGRLQAYGWPGNVRELENTIERAVVLATGTLIDEASISIIDPPAGRNAGGLPSAGLHENVEWAERESIRRALQQAGGVKKDAAALLGISQRALSHYLGKHRIGIG